MSRYIRRSPEQPWRLASRRVVKDIKREMNRALGPFALSRMTETVEIIRSDTAPSDDEQGEVFYLRDTGRFASFFPSSARQRQRLAREERERRERLQP